MPHARITSVASAVPALVSVHDIAAFLAPEQGGDKVTHIAAQAEIATKGLAVDPRAEDPRGWSTHTRMLRARDEVEPLAERALGTALSRAGVAPEEVDFFAPSTSTVQAVPGLDVLADKVGMRENAQRMPLGPAGCYAAVPSLNVCRNQTAVNGGISVLLVADMFSPHLQPPPYDNEQAVVLTLFGDGAGSAVIRPGTDGHPGLDILDVESLYLAEHRDALKLEPSASGLRMALSPDLPDIVAKGLATPVDALLARNRLGRDDIAHWAVHPGGLRVIDAVASTLALPEDQVSASRAAMRAYGNTAGPAVLTVLERLWDTVIATPGQHTVILSFGPGATIYAMLLRSGG
ncbi:type III polyketide synthase [Saccharopolyspora taberi]|uniref:Type III polyketide synthase n=1 Tax=Saccharopolyspora taberi TaxID=60895 RepID=A0ABN3VEN6_9PSEU